MDPAEAIYPYNAILSRGGYPHWTVADLREEVSRYHIWNKAWKLSLGFCCGGAFYLKLGEWVYSTLAMAAFYFTLRQRQCEYRLKELLDTSDSMMALPYIEERNQEEVTICGVGIRL